MSEQKHTPGPWTFKEGDKETRAMSDIFKTDDPDYRIGYVVCEAVNQHARVEDIANARLIAAAPDLLAACGFALRAIVTNDPVAAAVQLRIAIAKATGGA